MQIHFDQMVCTQRAVPIHWLLLLNELRPKGFAFQLDHRPSHVRNTAGKLTFAISGAVAEFKINIRRKPQCTGIAKAYGVYNGRAAGIDATRTGIW